ncbi:MAG: amidase [Pseudomonadota bacterium]
MKTRAQSVKADMKSLAQTAFLAPFLAFAACESAVAPGSEAPAPSATALAPAAGWTAKTLPELSAALDAGEVTAIELYEAFQARQGAVDGVLNAVLATNPDAEAQARASDARRRDGVALGPLDGLPILIKDNIETRDRLATTAGALALAGNVTGRDSPLVAGLRAQGVLILGKANLSQWANFRSERSLSGWSALGGQVRNPHMLDRNPCGSSSGSAVAAAAGLAAAAIGTETNGSISCPASVNGVVGFKPTVGLVSQTHIIPISYSQDTAGPMTRTVRGAAMLLGPMAGAGEDYTLALDAGALDGARIGVLRAEQGSNPDIIAVFDAALAQLEAKGASLVEITEFAPGVDNFWGKARRVLDTEFKAGLNEYLAGSPADLPVRTLEEVIAFNLGQAEVELALFDQSIFDQAATAAGLGDPEYLAALADVQRAAGAEGITALLAAHGVDALVAPSAPLAAPIDAVNGDVWPAWAGGGYLAAIAGAPHLTVPMGEVRGLPVGLSFMAAPGSDAQILALGYAYEQAADARIEPAYLATASDHPATGQALAPYPLGR